MTSNIIIEAPSAASPEPNRDGESGSRGFLNHTARPYVWVPVLSLHGEPESAPVEKHEVRATPALRDEDVHASKLRRRRISAKNNADASGHDLGARAAERTPEALGVGPSERSLDDGGLSLTKLSHENTPSGSSPQSGQGGAAGRTSHLLDGSDSPLQVVLVGCSSKKLDHAAPARELYTSPLFKKARAYAEARGCPWAILSALHGLVMPDEALEPYDKTLKGASRYEREEWGRKVQAELRARWPGATFVLLAGADYSTAVSGLEVSRGSNGRVFERANPLPATEPLAGMGIGQRLAWLERETIRLRRESSPTWECIDCGVQIIDAAARCASCAVKVSRERGESPEAELALCDFCGESVPCAVSELGSQRFEGDHTPARICVSCAEWALSHLRPNTVPINAVVGG